MSGVKLCSQISNLKLQIDTQLRSLLDICDPADREVETFINDFGGRLGRLIRKAVDNSGGEPDLESFFIYYGKLHTCKGKFVQTKEEEQVFRIQHCPMIDTCADSAILRMGNAYCWLDRAVIQGYNPNLAVKVIGSTKLGSASFWFESRFVDVS